MSKLLGFNPRKSLIRGKTNFINFSIERPGQDVRYALNDDKIRSIGWKPQCVFDHEIISIVEYYKNNFIW